MPSSLKALALLGLTGLFGCALPPTVRPGCVSNSDCASNEVCFPFEGCGDPGSGLVVEVQGDVSAGQLAQDFAIGDGGFLPTQDLVLNPATTLQGEFLRYAGATSVDPNPYLDPVTLIVRGESALIPGVGRSYQARFAHPERGTYSIAVGDGNFKVTAQPDDVSIPPGIKSTAVISGIPNSLNYTFPSSEGTVAMTGRLIKLIQPGPPPTQLAIKQAAIDLQAFDPVSNLPISQVAHTSSGFQESTGDFVIAISPDVKKLDSFLLVATPRDPGGLVPSKTFAVQKPFPTVIDPPLELGDFGDSLPGLQGVLTTTTGQPVAGASIYLIGGVNGGGIFSSKVVVSDQMGGFKVDLLPSATDKSYTLTALPPPGSTAGVLQTQVRAIAKAGTIATLSALNTGTSTVVCPDKVTVIGTVVDPSGAVTANVAVIAHAVQQLKERGSLPLPMGDTKGMTDQSGRFSIELDPGVYQIDYVPSQDLPRTSRVVTVRLEVPADGGQPTNTVDLKEYALSKPRRVTGTITLPPDLNTGVSGPAVNATVRYFHVTTIEGRPSSLLLGEALTDQHGAYSIVLPSH